MNFILIVESFFKDNFTLLSQIGFHLAVLYVAITIINNVGKKLKNKLCQNLNDANLINLLFVTTKIIKVIVILVVLASFLQCRGHSISSVMAGLGITGLAIGFAAKEFLSSILGSITIMTDRVYKIGDYISINGVEGVVEAINFRSTKIRTISNTLITIPNNITADTTVHNRSESEFFRFIETFDIEYCTTDEKVQEALDILHDICDNDEGIQDGHLALISKLGENAITLQLIANSNTNKWLEFLRIKDRLYKTVLKRFRANGISFAFPSRTLYVRKDEN